MKHIIFLIIMLLAVLFTACENSVEPKVTKTETHQLTPIIYTNILLIPYQSAYFGDLPDGTRIELTYYGHFVDTYFNGSAKYDVLDFKTTYEEYRYRLMDGGPFPLKMSEKYTIYFDYCWNTDNTLLLSIHKIEVNF